MHQYMLKVVLFGLLLAMNTGISGAQLRIASVTPRNTTATVEQITEITIVFSEPIVAMGAVADSLPPPFIISPAIAGDVRWAGSSTCIFKPDKPLVPASAYSCRIPAGFKALSGAVLEKEFVWSFETPRPRLVRHHPRPNQRQVRKNEAINLYFNQPIDSLSALQHIRLVADEKVEIPFRIHIFRKTVKGNAGKDPDSSAVKIDRTHLVITPVTNYPPGSQVTVKINAGLTGRAGPLPLKKSTAFSFKTEKIFRFKGLGKSTALWPDADLVFKFSNPISFNALVKNISFDPKIEVPKYYFGWESSYENLTMGFYLKPDTTYSFRLSPDLQDIFGNRLGRVVEGNFTTRGYRPSIVVPTGYGILEGTEDLRFPVEVLNINKIEVTAGMANLDSVITRMGRRGSVHKLVGSSSFSNGVRSTWDVDVARNERRRLPFDLKPVLGEKKHGTVLLKMDTWLPSEIGISSSRALLQVTSLAITGKFSAYRNSFFVSRLDDAKPVSGARIQIRDGSNRTIWKGQTNVDGIVMAPGWSELGLERPSRYKKPLLWVIAETDSDMVFIRSDWGSGLGPWRFGISYEWNPDPVVYRASLHTDRGIYRTSENLYLKGIVRRKKGDGSWILDADSSRFHLQIQDARGEDIVKKDLVLNEFGAFDDSLMIAASASVGEYTVRLSRYDKNEITKSVGYTSFRVEAFKPAEFEVSILPFSSSLKYGEFVFGDSLNAQATGRYLFGAPMMTAPAKWRLQVYPHTFRFPEWPDYDFGYRSWEDDGSSASFLLAQGKGVTDSSGAVHISSLLQAPKFKGGASILIESTMTSQSRQQISGRRSVKVHRGEFEIGIKLEGYLFEAGKSLACSIAVVQPSGEAESGVSVEAKLYRIEWESVRKAGVGGRYSWVSRRKILAIDSLQFLSSSSAEGLSFKPEKSGYYIIASRAVDQRGNVVQSSRGFYVSGSDYVAWARDDDDIINLVADKESYAPGDTAHIMIQSPFEQATSFISIERESVIDAFVENVNGSAHVIHIPIKEAYLPNVYVSVVLRQGRIKRPPTLNSGADLGKPQFKMGYTNLVVSPEQKHLSLMINTGKTEFRPQEEVELHLAARLQNGLPAATEFTVAVADAGVLNLIGYKLKDPFKSFYSMRGMGVHTAETLLHLIEQRHYGEKAESPGGGGADGNKKFGADLRSAFEPLAHWSPALRANEKGEAVVKFRLPDNLSTFRVMVIAHTKDGHFGAGSRDIVVSKPLILQPSSPRFVRIEDDFEAGVVATNNSANPGKIEIVGMFEGLQLSGSEIQSAQLKPGESREFRFSLAAREAGEARLSFKAEMEQSNGLETDGIHWKLPINFQQVAEHVATFGVTETKAIEVLALDSKKIFLNAGRVEVTAASTAMVDLKPGIRYLFEYPYGCYEQKLSKVLPWVLAGDLIDAFALAPIDSFDYRDIVKKTLADLPAFQNPNGGVSLWSGSNSEFPYLSAFALWALASARNEQYEVPEKSYKRLITYVQRLLRRKYSYKSWNWGNEKSYLATRALAYYALGSAGKIDRSYGEVLFREREKMSVSAKALLLQGMIKHGVSSRTRNVLAKELLNNVRVEARTAYFVEEDEGELWWCWSSKARTTAIATQALLENETPFPMADRVVRWLLGERKQGRWRSTQENIYIFQALMTYFNKFENVSPDFKTEISTEEKTILSHYFKGRQDRIQTGAVPLANLPAGSTSVRFSKTGAGRLYYGLSMRYFPKSPLPEVDQGISIKKSMSALDGSSLDQMQIRPGELLKVTLTISTTRERHFVVLKDPLPAGFEAVNTQFKTESSEVDRALGKNKSRRPSHLEMRDDHVQIFADVLPPGVHTFTYAARATTPGEFVSPAPHAEEMYAPEIFGRGRASKIRIMGEK